MDPKRRLLRFEEVRCRQDETRWELLNGQLDAMSSPSTERHDRIRKLDLYGRAGVRECWLVTPNPFMVEVYTHQAGIFARAGAVSETGQLRSPAFPELKLDLAELYASLPATPPPADEVRESLVSYHV